MSTLLSTIKIYSEFVIRENSLGIRKYSPNMSYKIITIVILTFVCVLFLAQNVNAGAVINKAPTSLGLISGLVGYWSFDGPDMVRNRKSAVLYDGLSDGPGETCTPLTACRGQYVTAYITGPGPSWIVKQKEPFFKDSFC